MRLCECSWAALGYADVLDSCTASAVAVDEDPAWLDEEVQLHLLEKSNAPKIFVSAAVETVCEVGPSCCRQVLSEGSMPGQAQKNLGDWPPLLLYF